MDLSKSGSPFIQLHKTQLRALLSSLSPDTSFSIEMELKWENFSCSFVIFVLCLRQTFKAIRYIQVSILDLPRKDPRDFQAWKKTSCIRSCASIGPSAYTEQTLKTLPLFDSTICLKSKNYRFSHTSKVLVCFLFEI